MSEHVRVERHGAACWPSRLTRPERRNAITVAMYAALADAIESAASDDERAADHASAARARTSPPATTSPISWPRCRRRTTTSRSGGCCGRWPKNEVPIVAAVHGNAVGIGTTMLFHCDLVMAEEGSRFSMPFVDLGLVPEAASSLLLPRLAGRRRAARYLLLGEPFGAEEALEFGLVSHVVAGRASSDALVPMVAALLAKPAEALRLTQRLLRRGQRGGNAGADGAGKRAFRRAADVGRGQARRSAPSSRARQARCSSAEATVDPLRPVR